MRQDINNCIDNIISICKDNCNLLTNIDDATNQDIILRGILCEIIELKKLLK